MELVGRASCRNEGDDRAKQSVAGTLGTSLTLANITRARWRGLCKMAGNMIENKAEGLSSFFEVFLIFFQTHDLI